MEKKLNLNKDNELELMKILWEEEKIKLDLISKDEEKMKQKLEEMYRKNMVQ